MSAKTFDLFKAKKYGNVQVKHSKTEGGGVLRIDVILHQTVVASCTPVNGVTTLDSGGWRTATTKVAMNTALRQLHQGRIAVYQEKGRWYVATPSGDLEYFDGMVIGGGSGIPFTVLNRQAA